MAFRPLPLAVPDSVTTKITIAYPERIIMVCTLVVIVFSVNAGKVINTRSEVVEARGRDSHMKQTGMLVGNFEFNPLKETIWAWLKLFMTPKGDQSGLG